MKKDFTVSKIEAPEDGSPYVFVTFTDRNEPRSAGNSGEAIPFTSPEDLMKNLPKVMSNIYGAGGGISCFCLQKEKRNIIFLLTTNLG